MAYGLSPSSWSSNSYTSKKEGVKSTTDFTSFSSSTNNKMSRMYKNEFSSGKTTNDYLQQDYENYFTFSKDLEQKYNINSNRSSLDRVLDFLSVGQYAVQGALGAATDNNASTDSWTGFKQGLQAGNPFGEGHREWEYSFSDVLSNSGWKPTTTIGKVGKFAASLAGDILLDPLTYLTLGTGAVVKGTGTVVSKGGKVVERAVETSETVSKYLDEMYTGMGRNYKDAFSPEDISSLAQRVNGYKGVVENNWKYGKYDNYGVGIRLNSKIGFDVIPANTLRKFGDETIAPYFNGMVDNIVSSPVFKKVYGNRAVTSKIARSGEENAIKAAIYNDVKEGIYGRLNKANIATSKLVGQMKSELNPEDLKSLTKMSELGYEYADILKFGNAHNVASYENVTKHIDDTIAKFSDDVEAMLDGMNIEKGKLAKVQQEADRLDKLKATMPKSANIEKQVEGIKSRLEKAQARYDEINKLHIDKQIEIKSKQRVIESLNAMKKELNNTFEGAERLAKNNPEIIKTIKKNSSVKYSEVGATHLLGYSSHSLPFGYELDKVANKITDGKNSISVDDWFHKDSPISDIIKPKESYDDMVALIKTMGGKQANVFLHSWLKDKAIISGQMDMFGWNKNLTKKQISNLLNLIYKEGNSKFMRSFVNYQKDANITNKVMQLLLPKISKTDNINNIVKLIEDNGFIINKQFQDKIDRIAKLEGDIKTKAEEDLKTELGNVYNELRREKRLAYTSNNAKLVSDYMYATEKETLANNVEYFKKMKNSGINTVKSEIDKTDDVEKLKELNRILAKKLKTEKTIRDASRDKLMKDYSSITDKLNDLTRVSKGATGDELTNLRMQYRMLKQQEKLVTKKIEQLSGKELGQANKKNYKAMIDKQVSDGRTINLNKGLVQTPDEAMKVAYKSIVEDMEVNNTLYGGTLKHTGAEIKDMVKEKLAKEYGITDADELEDLYIAENYNGKLDELYGFVDEQGLKNTNGKRDIDVMLTYVKQNFKKMQGIELTEEYIDAMYNQVEELFEILPSAINRTQHAEAMEIIQHLEKRLGDVTQHDIELAKRSEESTGKILNDIGMYQDMLAKEQKKLYDVDSEIKNIDAGLTGVEYEKMVLENGIKTLERRYQKALDDMNKILELRKRYDAVLMDVKGDMKTFIRWHDILTDTYKKMAVDENMEDFIQFYAPHLIKDEYKALTGVVTQSIFSHAIGDGAVGTNVHEYRRAYNISIEDFKAKIQDAKKLIEDNVVIDEATGKVAHMHSEIFGGEGEASKFMSKIKNTLISKIKDGDLKYLLKDRIIQFASKEDFTLMKNNLKGNYLSSKDEDIINNIVRYEIEHMPHDLFEEDAAKMLLARGKYSNKMVFSKEINDELITIFSENTIERSYEMADSMVNMNKSWLKEGENFFMTSYDIKNILGMDGKIAFTKLPIPGDIRRKIEMNGVSIKEVMETLYNKIVTSELDNTFVKMNFDVDEIHIALEGSKLNRMDVEDILVNIKRKILEEGKNKLVIANDEIFKQYDKVAKAQFNEGVDNFLSYYDMAQRWWKTSVTVLSPSFHVGNKVGATFNNFLDIGMKIFDPKFRSTCNDIRKGQHGVLTTKSGKTYTFEELRAMSEEYGVTQRSFYANEISQIENSGKKLKDNPKALKFMKDTLNLSDKTIDKMDGMNILDVDHFYPFVVGTKFAVDIENSDRFYNFVAHLQDDMDPTIAIERVNTFLFDYSRTTEFEQDVIKRLIPFWVWTKNNMALQGEMLFRRTSVYRNYAHVRNSFQAQIPEEERLDSGQMPLYTQDNWDTGWSYKHAETGRTKRIMWNPGLPINDLSVSTKTIVSKLSPFIKAPIEQATGKSLYFGTDLKESPGSYMANQVPVPNIVKGLNVKDDREALLNTISAGIGIRLSDVSTKKGYYLHYDKLIKTIKEKNEKLRDTKGVK